MRTGKRWYEGTADAIYQNLRFMELEEPEQVCIFGSDHIYKMDIKQMLNFHSEKQASLTVSALRMPLKEASQFGLNGNCTSALIPAGILASWLSISISIGKVLVEAEETRPM